MIFVTGGTGLVGSHLLLTLLQRGESIRALKRPSSNTSRVLQTLSWYSSANAEELFNRIEWIEGDIMDIWSVEKMLVGVTMVYHCAAVVSFDRKSQKSIITQNVKSTANLVNASIACGIKRFCHVSSVAALGKTSNGMPVNEETQWMPSRKVSGYAESKFFSETEIWRGVEEGLDCVVVNPSIIIGPGNWKSGSASFFRVIDKGMKFYTGGATGFVDVRDVTDAMVLLMSDENFEKAKNQRFLLNAVNLSYREFFTHVAESLGKPAPHMLAAKWMLGIASVFSEILSFITRKPAQINRNTLSSANSVTLFDGSKITSYFKFNYRPVAQAIEHTAGIFMQSGVKNK